VRVDTVILMKFAPDSLARDLASIDLPHPGGPYSRTPFGAVRREEEPKSCVGLGDIRRNALGESDGDSAASD